VAAMRLLTCLNFHHAIASLLRYDPRMLPQCHDLIEVGGDEVKTEVCIHVLIACDFLLGLAAPDEPIAVLGSYVSSRLFLGSIVLWGHLGHIDSGW